MAKVQLCNITVMDNPSPFLNPFQFEITFECIEELREGTVETNAESVSGSLTTLFRSGMENDLRGIGRERRVRPGLGLGFCWSDTRRKTHVCLSGDEVRC